MNELINKITTGDARELIKLIPDESIDLIFTDPVYDRIEDYEWLAKEASRILKPDRACLTWCGIGYLPEAINALLPKLNYRWTCGSIVWHTLRRGEYGLYSKWACLLWFDKGRVIPSGWAFDMHQAGNTKSGGHRWQKQPFAVMQYMRILPGIVFDPFAGGGTIPAVCKMLNRDYIAFEINPETAELARERVLNTQPPLFVLEPEQLEFDERITNAPKT